jgi:hypothetical protein
MRWGWQRHAGLAWCIRRRSESSSFRRFPVPEDPELMMAAQHTGLLGPSTAGLTLGYSIFIAGHCTSRLLAHECRHVYQYEQAGSIAAFLPMYLNQIAEVGYDRAPFEVDARAWENGG